MTETIEAARAQAQARAEGDGLVVELNGTWKITGARPGWADQIGSTKPVQVKIIVDGVFVFEAQQWCVAQGAAFDMEALPQKVRDLLGQFTAARGKDVPVDRSENPISLIGLAVFDVWGKTKQISHFVGECTLAALRLVKNPIKFRWRDCISEMQQCGAMALPIVGLIGMLVGLTLAYTAAVLLRQFGADIYVADFVGLVMVREMGPMMTAVVLSGRTGAAFAATLGNMKAGEEIDALETLGIRSIDFLVMPRLIALALMMPLLALYSNVMGMVGGMLVATGVLSIPPTAYWIQMENSVSLSDLASGMIKATTFGVIVGVAGCLRGLQSERNAVGVGRATTSAVVTAILLLVVADAVFAVLFHILGI
jgi:phospholipid/cholesterol/gamma-HCH transport system permease protein